MQPVKHERTLSGGTEEPVEKDLKKECKRDAGRTVGEKQSNWSKNKGIQGHKSSYTDSQGAVS